MRSKRIRDGLHEFYGDDGTVYRARQMNPKGLGWVVFRNGTPLTTASTPGDVPDAIASQQAHADRWAARRNGGK